MKNISPMTSFSYQFSRVYQSTVLALALIFPIAGFADSASAVDSSSISQVSPESLGSSDQLPDQLPDQLSNASDANDADPHAQMSPDTQANTQANTQTPDMHDLLGIDDANDGNGANGANGAATLAQASDLLSIYQQAALHNATYKAAQQTYLSQENAVGVSRAALLPQLTTSGSLTYDHSADTKIFNPSLNLTQQVINVADWATLSESQATAQLGAVTYATALQTMIYQVSTQYFTVLNDKAQLRYDRANALAQKRTLEQTEAQYKVGLNAQKDVLSAKAAYESAVAQVSSDEALLNNDLEVLNSYTGGFLAGENAILDIRSDVPLVSPSPANSEAWAKTAEVMNLTVQAQKMQAKVNALGVGVASAGFFPTVSVGATDTKTFMSTNTNDFSLNATASYNFFSSGATVFGVASAENTYESAKLTLVQDQRNAISAATQDYLSVISDLEQIDAYHEAVIAAQSAVDATFAGYKVGTETIVNLLQQQATLLQSQGNYARALFGYIKDSITLKRDAGVLTPADIKALNQFLQDRSGA
jgi:outer membrane protein